MPLETAQVALPVIFGSEFFGTATLILLGVGVVANNLLGKTKGQNSGTLHINFGWGLAVFMGVYVAYKTGGHLNPAVTLGLAAAGNDLAPGVAATPVNIGVYLAAQLLGAMFGAGLAWAAYKDHYDTDVDPELKLATFATGPAIRNPFWNTLTEVIATFVLVFWVLISGYTQGVTVGPLAVALVIVGIGASLGGPTGYAINPVRDLGPRLMHAVLPIKGKGGSDWGYAWVPVIGPTIGGLLAAVVYRIFW
ncbi:MIP/aquaporin family protein [Luteococcus sp. OSA5]|uniref:MIP/aquaporin family protein n=1 Tax=Luteococcus sp. OSA5 TaxID=3401630 RepID=UPI003B42F5E0